MEKTRVLLVEDDESLGFVVKDNLELRGFEVDLQQDGLSAKGRFAEKEYDICVLDVMLPKMDGFTLAEEIRRVNHKIPIIFLTARSMKEDRIRGFKLGGDDYLTKPFSVEELILRIEVFLRRSQGTEGDGGASATQDTYNIGQYVLNYRNLQLYFGNQEEKSMTQREADLLRLLVENKNNLVKREFLLTQLWGDDDYFKGRSMDVFISRLRKYLKKDPSVQIKNVHGVGFRLEED